MTHEKIIHPDEKTSLKIESWNPQSFGAKSPVLMRNREELLSKEKERAYQMGLQKGQEELSKKIRAEIEKEYQEKTETVKSVIAVISEVQNTLEESLVQNLLNFCLKVAGMITNVEGKINEAVLRKSLEEAFSKLPGQAAQYTIVINPADKLLVENYLKNTGTQCPIVFQEDPHIAQGGIRLLGAEVFIDATLEERLLNLVKEDVCSGSASNPN